MSATPRLHYALSFPAPADHRVAVEMRIDGVSGPTLELKMAVWTPGSYLVREFARHAEALAATDAQGRALPLAKIDKNTWRVTTGGAPAVVVRYKVYCFEPTVRTSFVDDERIALNGASVFLFVPGRQAEPVRVTVTPPPGMARIVTGLKPDAPGRFTVPNYDLLVDSPILIGNPAVAEFTVDGKPHEVAIFGKGRFDLPKLAGDCEKLVLEGKKIFGSLPYERYAFLLELAPKSGGGLEHLNSAHMFADPFALARREGYLKVVSLISHEYFHLWNVKRIRPEALGPFDYERENYTPSLWLAEGVTDYYADLMMRRAGITTREEYWKDLAETVQHHEKAPGWKVQSVTESSFDAWIKHYRPDEDSPNTTISYYVKGKLIGWLLDAQLRGRSGGKFSLDDLMRRLDALTRKEQRGYRESEVRALVTELVPGDWSAAFFRDIVDGTAPIDWSAALKPLGINVTGQPPKTEGLDGAGGWLGIETGGNGLTLTRVIAGSPAAAAGLNVNDELLALDGWRIATPDELKKRMEESPAGRSVELLVARRGRLRPFTLSPSAPPPEKWTVACDPAATPEAQARHLDYFGVAWQVKPAGN